MKKIRLTILFMMVVPTLIWAQNSESSSSGKLGLGIRTSIFQLSDFEYSDFPPNKLIINYDPIEHLRVEAQFGMYRSDDNENAGSTGLKPVDQRYVYALGVHYIHKLDKVKFAAGLRYLISDFSNEFIYYAASGNKIAKEREKSSGVSLVLGGEYFLAKWFSVGAEIAANRTQIDFTPAAETMSDDYTKNITLTESSVIFRFYPF